MFYVHLRRCLDSSIPRCASLPKAPNVFANLLITFSLSVMSIPRTHETAPCPMSTLRTHETSPFLWHVHARQNLVHAAYTWDITSSRPHTHETAPCLCHIHVTHHLFYATFTQDKPLSTPRNHETAPFLRHIRTRDLFPRRTHGTSSCPRVKAPCSLCRPTRQHHVRIANAWDSALSRLRSPQTAPLSALFTRNINHIHRWHLSSVAWQMWRGIERQMSWGDEKW